MPRYFTHYWSNSTCDDMEMSGAEGDPLDHLAGYGIATRGVTHGDICYAVTVRKGQLFLIGRMRVDAVVSQAEAADRLRTDPDRLWPADDHIIASAATPMHFDLPVSPAITQSLRFTSNRIEKPLKYTADGLLDQQTLRGIRELTPMSATALDALLEDLGEIDDETHVDENTTLDLPPSESQLDFPATADLAELERDVITLLSRGSIPLPIGQPTPRQVHTDTVVFARDPAVKAWVLQQAQGNCELCSQAGPFSLLSGNLFLEVHHVISLAARGPDTVENAVALCPNCHRRLHLSTDADAQREALYGKVGRLMR